MKLLAQVSQQLLLLLTAPKSMSALLRASKPLVLQLVSSSEQAESRVDGMHRQLGSHIAKVPQPLPAGQLDMPPFEAVARQVLYLAFPDRALRAGAAREASQTRENAPL